MLLFRSVLQKLHYKDIKVVHAVALWEMVFEKELKFCPQELKKERKKERKKDAITIYTDQFN